MRKHLGKVAYLTLFSFAIVYLAARSELALMRFTLGLMPPVQVCRPVGDPVASSG